MPPRHGKSELISRIFPTWYFGKNPESEIIVSSATYSYAKQLGQDIKDYMNKKEYKSLFSKIEWREEVNTQDYSELNTGGKLKIVGVGGQLFGFGAHLLVIDDPFTNMQDAESEVNRENVWKWFVGTALSRLMPDKKGNHGRIVIVMQRLHTEDIVGRLLETDKENWTVLLLPAIDKENKPLWEERFPLKELNSIRKSNEKYFQSMYQQEPMDVQERMFGDATIIERIREDIKLKLKFWAYLDPAFSERNGNDYNALTIGAIYSENNDYTIYIVHGEIWRSTTDVTYTKVSNLCKQYKVDMLFVETNNAKDMDKNFRDYDVYAKPINNSIPKGLRIQDNVKIHWKHLKFTNDVKADYLKQVLNYSDYAKHDDAPDSLAGLIAELKKMGFGQKVRNPFERYKYLFRGK